MELSVDGEVVNISYSGEISVAKLEQLVLLEKSKVSLEEGDIITIGDDYNKQEYKKALKKFTNYLRAFNNGICDEKERGFKDVHNYLRENFKDEYIDLF